MIRDDLSNDEYHAHPAISSSDVKAVLTSSVWHWKNKGHTEPTPAMQMGTAVHDMALEGGKNTIRGPENRRGNAWKEADADAKAKGKLLMVEKEYDMAERISQSLYADEVCAKQLNASDAKIEHSLFATCPTTGLELRCRPDLYNPTDRVMADVKKTTTASPDGFMREVYKYRYDVQSCFYKYVADLCDWPVLHFAFLAVEGSAPHAAHMHVMSQKAMDLAHKDMMKALHQIADAKKTGEYETGWGRFTMIHPPAWIENNHDFEGE